MSWFLSLILVGAVVSTGNNIPNYEYQNTAVAKTPKEITKIYGDVTDKIEKTYPFNPNGKIEVSNINGSIYIEAWDRPEISLEATKVASSEERLKDLSIDIDASQDNFQVEAEFKPRNYKRGQNYSYKKLYVTFRLKVPRTAILDDIETVNGSVTVSNMTKFTQISAVNGTVKASNLRGTAKLSTVNGTVYADFDQLQDNSTISLGTVNGSVKLGLPSNTNATVKADTVNGRISNQFGLPVRKGKYVGRDLYGRIGNGSVKIRLTSVNGGLSINNKDGGATNPAVNLLKQKTSDDFDESFDSQVGVNTQQMNKTISKAISKSSQAIARSAESIASSQVEMSESNREELKRNQERRQREIERSKRLNQKRIERNQERDRLRLERNKERDRLRRERDKERRKERIERQQERNRRQIERNKEIVKLNKEKFKEIERSVERVEESMVRASEAIYLSRRSPFMQEKTGSFEVQGTPQITIDAEDCDVVVKGWDKKEVKYTIARMTRTGNLTKDLRTKISNSKSKVEIEVTNETSGANSNKMLNKVKVEVFVPKKSNLKVSSSQEIRLEGVSGELELNGNDGSINVRDSNGRLRAESIDGTIRVIGFTGEVETTATDGDVYLEGDFKKIRSESKDGDVYLTLPNDANATIFTNGGVDVQGLGIENVNKSGQSKSKTLNIGEGGYKYKFNFVDGKLILRSKQSLISD